MHLTLLVPGLLWPREILRDTTFDLRLPALSRILGRGRRLRLASEAAWLARAFGLDAPLPAAALRLLGDGGWPGDAHWLCLDPVNLRLEQRAIVLDDPTRLALTIEEDAALRAHMAPLFAHLGEIIAPQAGRWYLRLDTPAALVTQALVDAVGRPVDPLLPGGDDGPDWRRILAEAQPLLHCHPVNQARASVDQPIVNSLWPWGLGRLPVRAQRGFDIIWSNDPILRGLGIQASILAEPLPRRFATVSEGRRVLVRLDHLSASLASFDAMAWRAALTRLEADWLAPALAALRRGECRRLTLLGSGHDGALQLSLRRRDPWRFWRRPVALTELAA